MELGFGFMSLVNLKLLKTINFYFFSKNIHKNKLPLATSISYIQNLQWVWL
jgi:hypothetical protein